MQIVLFLSLIVENLSKKCDKRKLLMMFSLTSILKNERAS
jgi:hypothetical protein